ncbi:MAG: hypothetical protein V8T38_10850 [Oscillospiraceae bacterium]
MDEIKTSDINAENRAEILNIIENFRLMDDTFMSKVFEDKACAELLLRVILNRDDLTVVRVVSQFELKNLQGRSARLDIYAVDEHGKRYDVEVQRSDDGADPDVRDTTAVCWTQICSTTEINSMNFRRATSFSLPSMTCLKAASRFTRSTARFPSWIMQYSQTVRT